MAKKRSIGILGYGSTGKYLSEQILRDDHWGQRFDLAFVWSRDPAKLDDPLLPHRCRLGGKNMSGALQGFFAAHYVPDIIVEVCHPAVVQRDGAFLLEHADLFIASVSALADVATERALRATAANNPGGHGLYLPSGAAWGIPDIIKMNELGTLKGLSVTMTFNGAALRLLDPLAGRLQTWLNDDTSPESIVLFEGKVRDLAPLAPNNVNTMTCLALAGDAVGLDHTRACLVAKKDHHTHIVEIEVEGPDGFRVKTTRYNPAKKGAVTGDQTYAAFLMSLKETGGRGNGLFFC